MTAPCKADIQAADRVLKRAVKKAATWLRADIDEPHFPTVARAFRRAEVVHMLTAAGTAADLLLEER